MEYSFTFREMLYESIAVELSEPKERENAGYLFCRMSRASNETRFIARQFWKVDETHILSASKKHISISSKSFTRALKHANDTNQCFFFVHSHPRGANLFSQKDDVEDRELSRAAYNRIHHDAIHGSLVFPIDGAPIGRVWSETNPFVRLKRIRVIGKRFRFYDESKSDDLIPEFFERQVRAFGKDVQRLLRTLHIAVVGCGGTGSAVLEQLVRLGVGKISVYDGQTFETSNVNRVYGSSAKDNGIPKVQIAERSSVHIGLDTTIVPCSKPITDKAVAMSLREVDVIFGCTDDEWGRSILNDIALKYVIPVIDLGVKIESKDGLIKSVEGRTTVLMPGTACLYCRKRISSDRITAEVVKKNNPDEYKKLRGEGYIPELNEPDPAVISFTSAVASGATSELIQRLTGFMGDERQSTETLYLFDRGEVRSNARKPDGDCKCSDENSIGIGDTKEFLGVLWN